MWIASHHTAGINSPEPSRGDFTPHFFFFFPFSYFGLGPSCCAQTSTHCPLLQSPLPTLVIHFPRPLAERGGCSRRRAPATSPPTRCSIDLFVQCLPPPLPSSSSSSASSSFPYFLPPILPLSVSVSSSASLPYVT